MPVTKILYVLQERSRAIENISNDLNSVDAIVCIGSSIPNQREELVCRRLVDYDVVPMKDAFLRKAILIPSVLNTIDPDKSLFDLIISIDGGFDMKLLKEMTNESMMMLQDYIELLEYNSSRMKIDSLEFTIKQ